DLEREAIADVVTHELEVVAVEQPIEIGAATGEEVVEADDLVAVREEPLAQVRAKKTRAARHESAFRHRDVGLCHRNREGAIRRAPPTWVTVGGGPSCTSSSIRDSSAVCSRD